jgi:predicted phage terminase large subunit-like protein
MGHGSHPRQVTIDRSAAAEPGFLGKALGEFITVDAAPAVNLPLGDQPVVASSSSAAFASRYRGYVLAECHQAWYDFLDSHSQGKLLLLAPREHGKTSSVLTYGLQRIASNRETRIGIISQTDSMAQSFMRDISSQLDRNAALIANYGLFRPTNPDVWNNHEVIIAGAHVGHDVSLFASGVGGQMTGKHADILFFDDIETLATVATPEQRAKTRTWFAREAIPVLSAGGQAVVIGTRKHEDDLYSWLIKSQEWLILDQYKSAIRPDGSALWPEQWPLAQLARRKAELDAVDLRAWSQEYLNEPVPSETAMFHPEAWPTYSRLPAGCRILQAWDLAISLAQTADWTACLTAAVDDDNNIYLMDAIRGHWDFNTTQAQIQNQGEMYGPESVGIEAVAYQSAAVQEALRRTGLPIVALRMATGAGRTAASMLPQGTLGGMSTPVARDKVSRARLLEARAAAGKVFRPAAPTAWWADFAAELMSFPSGAHDDWVDCGAYIAHMAISTSYDAGDVYDVSVCSKCGHMYYNPTETRPCPQCGTRQDV